MIRDHVRARIAHDHVRSVQERDRRGYGAHCHKLPILVHQAGLAPALHHTATLDKGKRLLLSHLAEQLRAAELIPKPGDVESLLRASREADLGRTWQLTRETMRCLEWYRRFAHSLLEVKATDEGGAP